MVSTRNLGARRGGPLGHWNEPEQNCRPLSYRGPAGLLGDREATAGNQGAPRALEDLPGATPRGRVLSFAEEKASLFPQGTAVEMAIAAAIAMEPRAAQSAHLSSWPPGRPGGGE